MFSKGVVTYLTLFSSYQSAYSKSDRIERVEPFPLSRDYVVPNFNSESLSIDVTPEVLLQNLDFDIKSLEASLEEVNRYVGSQAKDAKEASLSLTADVVNARRNLVGSLIVPTVQQTARLQILEIASRDYHTNCFNNNPHSTSAIAMLENWGNERLTFILYSQSRIPQSENFNVNALKSVIERLRDAAAQNPDININEHPLFIVLQSAEEDGLHAESAIIRYIDSRGTPANTLQNHGFLVAASQDPCTDCAGFLTSLNLPILRLRASGPAGQWVDPITGIYYNTRGGIQAAQDQNVVDEDGRQYSIYVTDFSNYVPGPFRPVPKGIFACYDYPEEIMFSFEQFEESKLLMEEPLELQKLLTFSDFQTSAASVRMKILQPAPSFNGKKEVEQTVENQKPIRYTK